jgi:hypothetical protein
MPAKYKSNNSNQQMASAAAAASSSTYTALPEEVRFESNVIYVAAMHQLHNRKNARVLSALGERVTPDGRSIGNYALAKVNRPIGPLNVCIPIDWHHSLDHSGWQDFSKYNQTAHLQQQITFHLHSSYSAIVIGAGLDRPSPERISLKYNANGVCLERLDQSSALKISHLESATERQHTLILSETSDLANGMCHIAENYPGYTSFFSGPVKDNLKHGFGKNLLCYASPKHAVLEVGTWDKGEKSGPFEFRYHDAIHYQHFEEDKVVGMEKWTFSEGRFELREVIFLEDREINLVCNNISPSEERGEFIYCYQDGIEQEPTVFLSMLGEYGLTKFISEIAKKWPVELLLRSCQALVVDKNYDAPLVMFSADISVIPAFPLMFGNQDLIDYPMIPDLFKQVLSDIETYACEVQAYTDMSLFQIMKHLLELLDPRVSQDAILTSLSKLFPEVSYQTKKTSAEQQRAIEIYKKNVLAKYLPGIIQRVHLIYKCYEKAEEHPFPETSQILQNLNQDLEFRRQSRLADVHADMLNLIKKELEIRFTLMGLFLDETTLAGIHLINVTEKKLRQHIQELKKVEQSLIVTRREVIEEEKSAFQSLMEWMDLAKSQLVVKLERGKREEINQQAQYGFFELLVEMLTHKWHLARLSIDIEEQTARSTFNLAKENIYSLKGFVTESPGLRAKLGIKPGDSWTEDREGLPEYDMHEDQEIARDQDTPSDSCISRVGGVSELHSVQVSRSSSEQRLNWESNRLSFFGSPAAVLGPVVEACPFLLRKDQERLFQKLKAAFSSEGESLSRSSSCATSLVETLRDDALPFNA